jgi:drug/metabolite transporter (DMT)-like permease
VVETMLGGVGGEAPARRARVGYVLVVTASVLFAVNGTVSKVILHSGFSAQRLTELRCAGALLGLGLLLVALAPERLAVSRRELPLLAAYGVAGVAMVQEFYFLAIDRLPVGIALLFEYTAPVLVALWARFVLHQPVRQRVWAALVLALSGLALVAEVWSGRLNGAGVAAALGGAVSLAVYYLLGEHSVGRRDPLSTTFWTFLFATLFWSLLQPWWSFPTGSVTGSASLLGNVAHVRAPLWLLLASMVVLGTIVPFALVLSSLRHLPATRVGVVGMLEPVIASAVAWVWLGEALSAVQLTGGAVVIVAVVLAQTAR